MTATIASPTTNDTITAAVTAACERIAPTWPLDQSVAINPWWQLIDQPFPERAAQLAAAGNVRALPSRTYLKTQWQSGRIQPAHLRAAIRAAASDETVETLVAHLDKEAPRQSMQLLPDVLDVQRDLDRQVAWRDEIIHQISQFCAAYFDQGQAVWHLNTDNSLYGSWLETVARERGIGIVMGQTGMTGRFKALPQDPREVLAAAVTTLGVSESDLPAYFHALLLSVNGWASWCAWRRWQARLQGGDDPVIEELLAIRLAWEFALFNNGADAKIAHGWRQAMRVWPNLPDNCATARTRDWLWLSALELGYQDQLLTDLAGVAQPTGERPRPRLQAAFCIDVRSEAVRRGLEEAAEGIETLGVAGFFGLPIAHQGLGDEVPRAQLPGLLAPSHTVGESLGDAAAEATLGAQRRTSRDLQLRWQYAKAAGPASFAYVESFGLLYSLKFLKRLLPQKAVATPATTPVLCDADGEIDAPAKAAIVAGMARILLQNGELAPLVLLVGHESVSCNNPHASGLQCGACGGQSGEVNARLLASLLNDTEVRFELAALGVKIPVDTRFAAGVHNTTTDEIRLCDGPAAVADEDGQLATWLAAAGAAARAERAARFGQPTADDRQLLQARRRAASDWSQVRPEWGLSGNAAFVIGPRSLTRQLSLEGRAFLHDYRWQEDPDYTVLQQLFGGPMVVTHWINMQYYASTVDNLRYGSGNKVLHNVVGGNLGVFEGNGGDLRIGLSMQSLNDGDKWVHEPVRLSVVVAAPREPIKRLIHDNDALRHLVDNDWLYLFQIDERNGAVARLKDGEWLAWKPGEA